MTRGVRGWLARDREPAAAGRLLDELPEPQRIALVVALARRMPVTATVGQREVGMAVLTVLRRLCEHRRVLIAPAGVS